MKRGKKQKQLIYLLITSLLAVTNNVTDFLLQFVKKEVSYMTDKGQTTISHVRVHSLELKNLGAHRRKQPLAPKGTETSNTPATISAETEGC